MKQLYKIILFLYLGYFVLKALPNEVFMMETKASKQFAFTLISITNIAMWFITLWLLLPINIATYPARFSHLMRTLESLEGQADVIRICLNEYKTIPEPLKKYDCFIPNKNLTDNGKFVFLPIKRREIYFSCDDDIIYPPDYVERTVSLINKYKCIVTYHGRLLQGLK